MDKAIKILGGNEERDRRLQVVKLLTALSYCVDSSFMFLCSSICFRICDEIHLSVEFDKHPSGFKGYAGIHAVTDSRGYGDGVLAC